MRISHKKDSFLLAYQPPEIDHEVFVEMFPRLPKFLEMSEIKETKRILLVYDSNLSKDKIQKVKKLLIRDKETSFKPYVLSYGEKSLERAILVWKEMLRFQPTLAVAFGGGVICDIVAFAASCYMRGIDHIFFPTTLLSMIDACIGGKTGIDFSSVKNSLGTIHYAKYSYCIVDFLKTLEHAELISGFSEAVKAAMLFDAQFFDTLSSLSIHKLDFNLDLVKVLFKAAEIKARITEQSSPQKMRLLYGHNVGHALETYDQTYRRHGDCVSVGLNIEAAIAVLKNVLSYDDWFEQNKLLRNLGMPLLVEKEIDLNILIKKMKKYRLYTNDEFLFVVPKKIGVPFETQTDYFLRVKSKDMLSLIRKSMNMIDGR